jgi:CheY-like chemotaxis protein
MARLLIVEDDANQRLLYREAFEEDGCKVIEARDGRDALTCIQRDALDAVVLDIDLPGMDGLDTLTRIHNLKPRLPVILNTAYAAYKDRYVSWLADAYVIKSSSVDELKRAVFTTLDDAEERSRRLRSPVTAG